MSRLVPEGSGIQTPRPRRWQTSRNVALLPGRKSKKGNRSRRPGSVHFSPGRTHLRLQRRSLLWSRRPRAGCARVPSAGSWGAEGSASCPAPRPCLPPGNVFPVTCHVCFCTGQGVWKDAVTRRTRGAAWAAPERPSAGSCSQRPRLQRPSLRDPATGSRPCAPRNGWLWQEQGCHQGHPSRPQSRWPSVHDSGPNGTSSPVEVSGEGCRRNQGTGSVSRGAVTPRGQPWPRAVPEAHGSVLHGGTAQAEGGSWGQSPRGLEFRACVHTRPKA